MYLTPHFRRVLLPPLSLIVKTIFFFEVLIYKFLSYIFMSWKYFLGFVSVDQILDYEFITLCKYFPRTLSGVSSRVIFSAVSLRCLITWWGSRIASAGGLAWLYPWREVIVWQRDLNLDERILNGLWLNSSFTILYFFYVFIWVRSTCLTWTYSSDFGRSLFRWLRIMGLETFILIIQMESL